MPVIVPPEAFDLWLDCGNVDALTAAALIMPTRDGLLDAYEVSPAVNRVDNDNVTLIEPFSEPHPPAPSIATPDADAAGARAKKPKADERQGSLF
jgi:hypothetical protein